jgi:hypothetical protein
VFCCINPCRFYICLRRRQQEKFFIYFETRHACGL